MDNNNVFIHLGPLIHYENGKGGPATLVGIVSWGIECATINWPGYYARVNQVLPWIQTVMSDCRTCPPSKTLTSTSGRQTSMDKTKGHSPRIPSRFLSRTKLSDITSTSSKSCVFVMQIFLTAQLISLFEG